MYYDITNEKDAIRQVQNSLLEISYATHGYPHIGVDGIYGRETRMAVRLFQERNGLRPSGIVDRTTWDELMRQGEYAERLRTLSPTLLAPDALPLSLHAEGADVYILQAMLTAAEPAYPRMREVPQTGRYDLETEYAVRLYQEYNHLPVTGIVDLATWERLAAHYRTRNDGAAL